MSLIHEIHRQPHALRLTLWGLSVFAMLSMVGYFWFTAFERDMFLALHQEQALREEFLARQDARAPKTLAAIGNAFGGLTASIGSLLGIDPEAGFDRPVPEDTVHLLPLSR